MTQIYVHKAFNYRPEGETARRRLEVGEIIEAKRKDAKVLVGARLAAYVTTEIAEGDLATTGPGEPLKRPRGRPRKYPLPASAQQTPQEAPRQPEPPPPSQPPPEPEPAPAVPPEAPSGETAMTEEHQQA